MSKFMIEDAQITKASSFEPLVSGNTPEVVNIASTLGKVAEWHDEIETSKTDISNMQDDITDHDTAITELQIDTGKNLIDMSNPSYQKGDIVDNHDGTYTLGGTGSWLRMDFDVDVTPGQLYRFKCDFKNVSGPHALFVIRDGGLNTKQIFPKDPLNNDTYNNTKIDDYFTPTENFVRVVFAPVEVGAPGDTGYMTVNPVLYKVSDNEAATRVLVDNGSKNLIDITSPLQSQSYNATVTTSDHGRTITIASSGTYAYHARKFQLPAGRYVVSANISNRSGSNYTCIAISSNPNSYESRIASVYASTGTVDFTFVTDGSAFWLIYYACTSPHTDVTTYTVSDVMICPKPVYGISSTYEPYALPNADLTGLGIESFEESNKNNLVVPSFSMSSSGYSIKGPINEIPSGKYILGFTTSGGNINSFSVSFYGSYLFDTSTDTPVGSSTESSSGMTPGKHTIEIDINSTAKGLSIWQNIPSGNTVTFSDFFLCKKFDYDISKNRSIPYDTSSSFYAIKNPKRVSISSGSSCFMRFAPNNGNLLHVTARYDQSHVFCALYLIVASVAGDGVALKIENIYKTTGTDNYNYDKYVTVEEFIDASYIRNQNVIKITAKNGGWIIANLMRM